MKILGAGQELDADIENGLEDMGRGKGKLGRSERVAWTYIHYQMLAGSSRIAQGDQLVLCDHLEGWDREGGRRKRDEIWGHICICITDLLCYKAETNTPL